MKLNESEALTSTLRNRNDHLLDQIKTIRGKYGANANVEQQEDIDFNFKHPKTRSQLAMFYIENKDAI